MRKARGDSNRGEACGVCGGAGGYTREGRLEGEQKASPTSPECQAKEKALCLRAREKLRKAASQTYDRSLLTSDEPVC